MSGQRKFNYSFRERRRAEAATGSHSTEKREKSEPKSFNDYSKESKADSVYPSDCENEPLVGQPLPQPDQPISAADLECRKNSIRGMQTPYKLRLF